MRPALVLAFYRRARSEGFSRAQARRWALRLAATVTVLVTASCADAPYYPEPSRALTPERVGTLRVGDPDCYPNHSGVCEGPPLSPEEMEDVQDALRRIQARDTTNGRDIEL